MLNCATKPIYKLTFRPRRCAAAFAVPGLNIPRARASVGLIEYELHTKGLRLGARARALANPRLQYCKFDFAAAMAAAAYTEMFIQWKCTQVAQVR